MSTSYVAIRRLTIGTVKVLPGEVIDGTDMPPDRLARLLRLDLISPAASGLSMAAMARHGAVRPKPTGHPQHVGGGYYLLSDGARVQGKLAAHSQQRVLDRLAAGEVEDVEEAPAEPATQEEAPEAPETDEPEPDEADEDEADPRPYGYEDDGDVDLSES